MHHVTQYLCCLVILVHSNKHPSFNVFITDHVRGTTGRLCFDTCLSVCPHPGEGTPARSRRGVPQPGLTRGVPQPGGTHLWYSPQPGQDGGGYSSQGDAQLGYPLARSGQGGTPARECPPRGTPPR